MSLKDDLLRQADDDLALTRALVGLDDEAMGRPCLGAWGVREILAQECSALRKGKGWEAHAMMLSVRG
jgi:hypothetical protein